MAWDASFALQQSRAGWGGGTLGHPWAGQVGTLGSQKPAEPGTVSQRSLGLHSRTRAVSRSRGLRGAGAGGPRSEAGEERALGRVVEKLRQTLLGEGVPSPVDILQVAMCDPSPLAETPPHPGNPDHGTCLELRLVFC